MSYEIKADKILIRELFKMWFRIPDYQRPYVWGTDQVQDLILVGETVLCFHRYRAGDVDG